MQRTNVWTPRGESGGGRGGGGMNWEIGIDMYTLMCIKWMTNKNLLYKKINQKKKKRFYMAHTTKGRKLGGHVEILSTTTP